MDTHTVVHMYTHSRRHKKFPHRNHSNHSTVRNALPSQRSCTVIVGIVHHITVYYSASCVIIFDTSAYFASNIAEQWYFNSRNMYMYMYTVMCKQ